MLNNGKSYCIGIVTYSKRKEYVERLIDDLRKQTTTSIFLAINADYKKDFDNKYRNFILNLCAKYENVYPSFYLKFKGLAKLWNDLIINCGHDNCIILNDDIIIKDGFINNLIQHKERIGNNTIMTTNNMFCAFVVNKNFMDSIGYFNEYYIGIGFEDYEFHRRMRRLNLLVDGDIQTFKTNDFVNLTEESVSTFIGNENNKPGDSKTYSNVNNVIFHSGTIEGEGMDLHFRPFEKFYEANYDNIFG